MQAFRLTGWKQSGQLQEIPEPEPGPGQVLVRVGGSGACHSDLHLLDETEEGVYSWTLPFTLGHETAGWVEALGPGATGFEVGEPVAVFGPWGCGVCPACQAGQDNVCERAAQLSAIGCGLGFDGGMAPLVIAHSTRHLLPLGDLDPVQAAPLTDAALTPYHAIKANLSRLGPQATVVVIGAGGLGHMAIQILRALSPARIVAVDRREDTLALAKEVGADETVDASDDATVAVEAATHGRGADVVLDCVGADDTLRMGRSILRAGGQLVLIGLAGGRTTFSFFTLRSDASLAISFWGSKPELAEVLALARRGLLAAHIERFSLEQAPEAYERLRKGQVTGRAVIVPG